MLEAQISSSQSSTSISSPPSSTHVGVNCTAAAGRIKVSSTQEGFSMRASSRGLCISNKARALGVIDGRCPAPTLFKSISSLTVEDEFICCLCGGVMVEPVVVPSCGHDFSLLCGIHHATAAAVASPTDESVGAEQHDDRPSSVGALLRCPHPSGCDVCFTIDELRPASKMSTLISKLGVECPNKCGWAGVWGALSDHRAMQCSLEALPCPFDCGNIVVRGEINAHKKVCLRRFEQCTHCLVPVRYHDRPLHEARCSMRPVVCEGCGLTMQERGLAAHKEHDCAGTLVPCPFAEYGCSTGPIRRGEVGAHIDSSLHQHCLHLVGQIKKEREESAIKMRLLEERIRELEESKGLADSEEAEQAGALMRTASTLLGLGGGFEKGRRDDVRASKSIVSSLRRVPSLSPPPEKSNDGEEAKLDLKASTSPSTSASPDILKSLIGPLEGVVSLQQQLVDRFLSGSVLCVDSSEHKLVGQQRHPSLPLFTSIAAAMEAALPGDMVLLRPGTYKENITLTKPNVWLRGVSSHTVTIEGCVTIRWPSSEPLAVAGGGDGELVTSMSRRTSGTREGSEGLATSNNQGAHHRCCAEYSLTNLALSNVTIMNTSNATSPALRVKCGTSNAFPRIQNCTIMSSNLACVVVDAGQPSFESCKMTGSKQFGILWRAPDRLRDVSNTHSSDRRGDGSFESGLCTDGVSDAGERKKRPLSAAFSRDKIGGGASEVSSRRESTFSTNLQERQAHVERTFFGPSSASLLPAPSWIAGRIVNCLISDNKSPNIIVEAGAVIISGTTVERSSANGLVVKTGATVHVEDSTIRNNAYSNIDVLPNACIRLERTLVHGSLKAGLYLNGVASLRSSRIFDNEMPNIVAMPHASALVIDSKLNGSQQYGLVAKSNAKVRLVGCEVKGNGFDNIVSDHGAFVELEERRQPK